MAANHLLSGLSFGLSMSVISWMVGVMGGPLLLKTRYVERLSHLNFIPSKALNRAIGIAQFKWIVKHTVFRFLNQSIKVDGKRTDLASIRHQMTIAEVNHLVGFLFVAAAAVYQSLSVGPVFGVSMMIPNLLLNGYPSLLQQENKRRIDELLRRQARHNGATAAP